jgi:U2 small nuclear ribonucleoprotein A'
VIDLSDNEIRKLDNFPALPRLTTLYLNNNRVTRISESIAAALPNLLCLMLTNNQIIDLSDLHALSHLKKLRSLSLLGNLVTKVPNYRLFVIHCLPTLKLLDFRKVKQKV